MRNFENSMWPTSRKFFANYNRTACLFDYCLFPTPHSPQIKTHINKNIKIHTNKKLAMDRLLDIQFNQPEVTIIQHKTQCILHDLIKHWDHLQSFSFILSTAALRVSSSLQKTNLTRFFPSSGFKQNTLQGIATTPTSLCRYLQNATSFSIPKWV